MFLATASNILLPACELPRDGLLSRRSRDISDGTRPNRFRALFRDRDSGTAVGRYPGADHLPAL
jgi:hypothetical protein